MDIFKVIKTTKFLALYLNLSIFLLLGKFSWSNGLNISLDIPIWVLVISGVVQAICLYFRFLKKKLIKQHYLDLLLYKKEELPG